MAAAKPEIHFLNRTINKYIVASTQAMVEISTVNRYFGDSVLQLHWCECGITNPKVEIGSVKSKIAASEPEPLISRLVDEIETKSERLNLHFWSLRCFASSLFEQYFY